MKLLFAFIVLFAISMSASAGERDRRVGLGVGLLYSNGLDVTLSYELENANHNA